MQDTLEGKVALVTGAGMGMGKSTAELLARHGAKVVVADISEEAGCESVEEIINKGGEATFVKCDVSSESDVRELVASTVSIYGRLDCAVNNAAIPPYRRSLIDVDMQEFDRIIAVDLRSVVLCLKYELAQMVDQGSGAIVNVGSVASVRPTNDVGYVAAKHGVVGATKVASYEYAPKGVRVNAVLPGGIMTPMMEGALGDSGRDPQERAAELSLLGRFGRPEEVAEASLWLLSDASSYVTGHSLAVEAGYLTR